MEPNPLCTQLPVFDLSAFLSARDRGAPEAQRLCAALAACLQQCSALVVRDPRVDTRDNEAFLDLMERYFDQVGAWGRRWGAAGEGSLLGEELA